MKHLLIAALLAAVTMGLAPTESHAKDMRLGVDGGVRLATGEWADVTGLGFGGFLRYEYLMSSRLTITGRAGYMYGLSKDVEGADFATSELPIMAGARYFFTGYTSKKREGLYVSAELGFVMMKMTGKTCFAGRCTSNDEDRYKLGMTAGVGYEFAGLDVNASAFLPESAKASDLFGMLFTLGYAFVSF